MMDGIIMMIRREKPKDQDAVYAVNWAAFEQPMEGDIVNTLRAECGEALSLVAEIKERVVGHIFFSPAIIASEQGDVVGMGLAPMAVHPDHQRQGIGSALVEAGVAALEKMNCPFIIVLGHPEFYPRFGFEPAGRHGIDCQWEVPDEAFMVRILDPSAMDGTKGVAAYRSEFDAAM